MPWPGRFRKLARAAAAWSNSYRPERLHTSGALRAAGAQRAAVVRCGLTHRVLVYCESVRGILPARLLRGGGRFGDRLFSA
jgi:hypothetical protein